MISIFLELSIILEDILDIENEIMNNEYKMLHIIE